MKRSYNLIHRLIAYILFIGLFLQSCGGFQNQIIPQQKKQPDRTLQLPDNLLIDSDKKIVASGGYLASFYEEDGELKADLKADEKQPTANYKAVPVLVEEGVDLTSLTKLDATTQQNRIELKRSNSGQLKHIIIRKSGLSGGMMEGDDYQEKEKKKEKDKKTRLKEIKKEYRIVTRRVNKEANKKVRRSGSDFDKAKKPFPHRRSLSLGDAPLSIPIRLPLVQKNNTEPTNMQAPQPPVPVNPIPSADKEADHSLELSEGGEDETSPQGPLHVAEENGEEEIRPNLPLSSDEEEEDDFVILSADHGSRLRLNQLEGEPLIEDLLIQESLSQKYLRILRINPQDLTPKEIEDLETILRIEGSWKNHFVWANLVALIHKTLFALTTNKYAINKRKQETRCAPLWLHGGPIPLDSSSAIKRNLILKTLGSSLEEGTIESLHTALLALTGYQLYKVVDSDEFSWNLAFFANFYKEADAVSYLGIIKRLHDSPALFALLATPFVFAIGKTLYTYLQISEPTDTAVDETVKSIRNRSRKWDWMIFNITSTIFDITSNILSMTPFLSSLLHLHPLKRTLPALTSLILWEGKLTPEARENAFTAIVEAARTRKGFSKMTAIESLYHLTHGMHIKNLIQRPHDVEELLHIKLRAFRALKEIYQELPIFSLNKFRTAALLWEMGQSPSWFISIIEPINKALRAALYAYTIYGIFDVLYKYFTCPYKYIENFTWLGGLESYASNYSQECFDAQVVIFNTLPGQPASTLVGDLSHYHFRGPYALDLSNKGIEGSVIADIVEGFNQAKVPLKSLNISFNLIRNSSDITRILAALPPEIINLDMTNVNGGLLYNPSNHFLGLRRLMGLQSFNISGNGLIPGDIGAIGQALQNLSHLKELRLAYNNNIAFGYSTTNITYIARSFKPSLTLLDLTGFDLAPDLNGQIALGNSLAKISTLKELYLGETAIGDLQIDNGTLYEAVLVAWTRGLSAQQGLRILDLSSNFLGQSYGNYSFARFLSSLPHSLTHLNLSGNNIGFYYQYPDEVQSLAQAVEQMSELTSFKAGKVGFYRYFSNELGSSPDFLKALQGKQNLTFLDLSWNSCNNSTLIRDLLQTTPNLKTIDLSNNQLTNGTILAPVFSTLRNLTTLNLGDNNFTTTDFVSIWKATSFLSQSPFSLDEDLNYTSAYLKSFPSTTTRLDLSRLIPNDPTVLKAIMPQVIDLFPHLRELDLSNNRMLERYHNHTYGTGGIQALNAYLPKLTHLQSLRIAHTFGFVETPPPPAELITFSQIIGHFPNLKTLDFSGTKFLLANSLGKGLKNIHSLTSISLNDCWDDNGFSIESMWQGGVQLMQGLQVQPNLVHLDLSNNIIGYSLSNVKDPNSTLALAKVLNSWPHLKSLNLEGCNIGYEDPRSTSIFLDKLAELAATVYKQGRSLEVNFIGGISNVKWTQVAEVLQKLTQQTIEDACVSQLCTGDSIPNPKPSGQKPSEAETIRFQGESGLVLIATSDATSSHHIPWYSPAKLVTAWKSWWEGPTQPIGMANSQVKALVKLQDKCDRLIDKADTQTADPWYRFSLEDLHEDIGEKLKTPTEISEDTVNRFYRQLEGIERDFLRKPFVEKPSFFATSNLLTTSLAGSNNPIDLWFVSRPLLGSENAPFVLGK